jgi:hypothetical protein
LAFWVDDQGELREGDEEQAQRYGFRPATDEDLAAHNERLDTQAADTKGPGGLVIEGAERGLGMVHDAPTRVFNALSGGPAWDPKTGAPEDRGLVEETPVRYGKDIFPEAHSEEARLRTKAHPVWEGIGTGLVAAPAAAAAAALTGGTGLGVLGGAGATLATEAAVEATAQEYDDAWLEKRPMELKNVVNYTAMFAVGDVLLRGVGKLGKRALGIGQEPAAAGASGALGGRNIVAEATAKAERAAGGNGSAARSVGAASAEEMQEPFDAAIGSMSDRDAVVLARDADDHLRLAARHSADDLTRLAKGLSESLGTQLKYRDVQIATDALKPHQLEAQAGWTRDIVDQLTGTAQHLRTGGPARINFGNAGKAIAADIEGYTRQMMDTLEPAKRFQLLDNLKKRLDSRVMAVGGDFHADLTARQTMLEILEPLVGGKELPNGAGITKGALREGLENPKYWGEAGRLQKSLNAPWHELLKHWSTIQKALLEHVETKFGATGANRRVMASDPDLWMSVWEKDPRSAAKIGNALKGMFDGYQGLIEAREAHGFVDKEGLPALRDSIANMMEDWNLASTVGIARNKVAHASRNPKKFEKLLALAEKTPFGVGSAIGAARHVAELSGDLRIAKGTPLADVWDRGLKRYALHPELGDVSISANYSPWMQDALRARGAAIPPPPTPGAGGLFGKASPKGPVAPAAPAASGGGLGQAAAAAAKEHGGKVAGAGLLAGSAALGDDQNPEGAAAAGVGGLALLLGKGGARLFKEEAHQLLGERLGPQMAKAADKDTWGHVISRRWLKSDAPLSVRTLEHENTKSVLVDGLWQKPDQPTPMPELRAWVDDAMQRTGATEDEVVRTLVSEGSGFKPKGPRPEGSAPRKPKGPTPPAPAVPDGSGIGGEFDDMGDQLLTPPDMKETLKDARRAVGKEGQAAFKAYQSQAGYKMNEAMRTGDFSSWGAERSGDVQSYLQQAIDSGATAPGFVVRGVELSKEEVQRLTGAKLLTAKAFVSTSPNASIAKRFAGTAKRGGQDFRKTIGDVPVMFEIEQATGVPLSAGEVTLRPGTQFKVLGHRVERVGSKAEPKILHVFRVRESGYAPGAKTEGIIAGGLLGLGGVAAAGNANAAEPPPERDPGPSPQVGPVGVYRDAMRTVAQGGEALIRQKATAALRFSPPKGRGALHAFMGRRGLDDAVDAARDAIRDLQGDPSALVDRLAATTGELGVTHPAVYMALVEKAHGLVSYLAAEAPQRTGQTLLDPEGSPPSLDRSVDFAFKAVGALMPVQAMNDIARLDAAPEEVASFQQNWAELWEPLRAELLGQVQRRTEAGRPVDAEKLRQLDSLLQMDGQLDPSASSAVAQQMLAAQEQAAAPAQGGAAAPSGGKPSGAGSSSFRTRLEGAQMENAIG